MAILRAVHDFVQEVIIARQDPARPEIHTFRSKVSSLHQVSKFGSKHIFQWRMKSKTKYTLVPLPGLAHEPFLRRTLDSSEQWRIHLYPYQILAPLECHIAPPFAIINAGPNAQGPISMRSHEHVVRRMKINKHLRTGSSFYARRGAFSRIPGPAQRIGKWERGVRGRGNAMIRILKDFRNRANAPLGHSLVHRVVVQDESLLQLATVSIQSEIGIGVLEPASNRRRSLAVANGNGHIAQADLPLANIQFHVSENDRRQKTCIGWSNTGLSPPVVDEARSLCFLSFPSTDSTSVYTYSSSTPLHTPFLSSMQLSLVCYS
jgi:hypothetical protein